jgi:hypothetical protein
MKQNLNSNQINQIKILRAVYPMYVKSGDRIGLVLESKDGGKLFEAFLDPKRIKKVIEAVVPFEWNDGWKSIVVIEKDGEVHYTRRPANDVERTVKMYAEEYKDAKIFIDYVVRYFIFYESNHNYYDPATVEKIEGVVVKEGSLELLIDVSREVRKCGNGKWRVYLAEAGRWDSYCFSLSTAFNILTTNVHPYYGVMD